MGNDKGKSCLLLLKTKNFSYGSYHLRGPPVSLSLGIGPSTGNVESHLEMVVKSNMPPIKVHQGGHQLASCLSITKFLQLHQPQSTYRIECTNDFVNNDSNLDFYWTDIRYKQGLPVIHSRPTHVMFFFVMTGQSLAKLKTLNTANITQTVIDT